MSAKGRIRHKVNFFKQSKASLNSEFSFFKTGCLTKMKEPSLFFCVPIAGWVGVEERGSWFSQGQSEMQKQIRKMVIISLSVLLNQFFE